jgi:hypothetical protein
MSALLAAVVIITGLHGTVVRGPTEPVCRMGQACSAPAVGAVLVFSREGRVVARARTDVDGRYAVRLAPGTYAVRRPSAPAIGTGLRPATVRVVRGHSTRVDFFIDTGIR